VAPDRIEMQARLGVAAGTMDSILRQMLSRDRASLQQCVHVIERKIPDVRAAGARINDLVRRSLAVAERTQRDAAHGVGSCVWRLKSLDPYATLERGYAIVQKHGALVATVGGVKAGDAVDIRVMDGTFGAVVGGAAPAPRRRSRRAVSDAQAPLFTMPEDRA
jgi:exonuclease VII large subunit